MQSIQKQLGLRLRQLRLEQGLSVPQVAVSLGCHVTHVYAMERGVGAPSLESMVALALLYRIDIADLFVFPETHLRHRLREALRHTSQDELLLIRERLEELAPPRREPRASRG